MVRVVAIKRVGESVRTSCNSWHRLLGQDCSHKLVGNLSDASVTLALFNELSWFSVQEAENFMCTLNLI